MALLNPSTIVTIKLQAPDHMVIIGSPDTDEEDQDWNTRTSEEEDNVHKVIQVDEVEQDKEYVDDGTPLRLDMTDNMHNEWGVELIPDFIINNVKAFYPNITIFNNVTTAVKTIFPPFQFFREFPSGSDANLHALTITTNGFFE